MRLDPTTTNSTNPWAMPEEPPRVIVDERGIEWEVYDEAHWSMELALEWDFLPQAENPGLIFASRLGRKRVWPCPDDWRAMDDRQLVDVLGRAKTIL